METTSPVNDAEEFLERRHAARVLYYYFGATWEKQIKAYYRQGNFMLYGTDEVALTARKRALTVTRKTLTGLVGSLKARMMCRWVFYDKGLQLDDPLVMQITQSKFGEATRQVLEQEKKRRLTCLMWHLRREKALRNELMHSWMQELNSQMQ